MKLLIKIISTGFGVGYFPWAPGTMGSLVGVGLYLILVGASWIEYLAITLIVSLIAILFSHLAEPIFAKKDAKQIVIDEVAGQLVTFLFVPFSWPILIAGFVLFRLFDISKLFPANRAERIPGGAGVVLDDLVAGLQAALVLYLIYRYLIV